MLVFLHLPLFLPTRLRAMSRSRRLAPPHSAIGSATTSLRNSWESGPKIALADKYGRILTAFPSPSKASFESTLRRGHHWISPCADTYRRYLPPSISSLKRGGGSTQERRRASAAFLQSRPVPPCLSRGSSTPTRRPADAAPARWLPDTYASAASQSTPPTDRETKTPCGQCSPRKRGSQSR